MRTFEHTHRSQLTNFIQPNNADVFISTWDVLGMAKHDKLQREEFQEPINIQHIQELYGPNLKKLAVFNFDEIRPTFPDIFYVGMLSMYWQIKKANDLRKEYEREQDFQYDLIFRSRPDLLFHTGLEIDNPGSLGETLWVYGLTEHWVKDVFALGTSVTMDVYSQLYDKLPEYATIRDSFVPPPGETCVFWPEQLLKHHLEANRISIREMPIQLELCRTGMTL